MGVEVILVKEEGQEGLSWRSTREERAWQNDFDFFGRKWARRVTAGHRGNVSNPKKQISLQASRVDLAEQGQLSPCLGKDRIELKVTQRKGECREGV